MKQEAYGERPTLIRMVDRDKREVNTMNKVKNLCTLVAVAFAVFAAAATNISQPSAVADTHESSTVLVPGASGKSGRFVMAILTEQGYDARGMTRNVERASAASEADYAWVQGDVKNPQDLSAAMEGVDYVICTIGTQEPTGENSPEFVDYGGVRNLVDAAKAANVKHFVLLSSAGASREDPEDRLNKMFGNVVIWKHRGENYLKASGLDYTIVRPGGLLENLYELGERGLKFEQGDTGTGIIHRGDVAEVLVAALKDPAAKGKSFELYSDENAPADNWRDGGFANLSADE